MEEQILKIIESDITQIGWDEYGNPTITDAQYRAKKIAIHFTLFTEWCIEWVYFEEPNYHLIIRGRHHIDKALGTLSEVYQYWLINVKNKY